MLIDFHTHAFPERIAPAAMKRLSYQGGGLTPQTDGTLASLKEEMARDGVDISVVLSIATNPKQQRNVNDFAISLKDVDGLVPFGSVHHDSPDALDELERLKENGIKGVKLHPDIQAFKIDDYRCLKIYELCEQNRLPVLLHTGDDRYDYSNPNRLLPVLEIYKDLTFIGAHLAGYSIWEEACDKLGQAPNLYVDCSSSFFRLSTEKAEELMRRWGAERVLFGTDYPMWDAQKELTTLLSMHFTEEEFRKILWDNAYNLFVK